MNDKPAEGSSGKQGSDGKSAESSLRETRAVALAEHYQKTYELVLASLGAAQLAVPHSSSRCSPAAAVGRILQEPLMACGETLPRKDT